MSLEPTQLIAPEGEIEPAMFPTDTAEQLAHRVQAYITAGTEKASADGVDAGDLDDAARAWAYYRAFRAVFVRLSATPSSITLNDQGGTARLLTQIVHFDKLAADYLTEYTGLVPAAAVARVVPQSAATKTRITW